MGGVFPAPPQTGLAPPPEPPPEPEETEPKTPDEREPQEDQLDGDNTLRDSDTPKTWEASMEGLKDIPGIGKTTMKKIQEYFENIDN